MTTTQPSNGQIMSWYHSKILRIPHGNQNPTKRYLTGPQTLELFDGEVYIEEKVDGKLSCEYQYTPDGTMFMVVEDMTGKNTCHNHVMKYSDLPLGKRIFLNYISTIPQKDGNLRFHHPDNILTYGILYLNNLALHQIWNLLETFANLPSHFGSSVIEGIVIKNYKKQLMGKWINDDFEDKLTEEHK